jgi:hypothetical protein
VRHVGYAPCVRSLKRYLLALTNFCDFCTALLCYWL